HHDNPYGKGDGLTDGEIPAVPTKSTPRPFGADRLGVIALTPDPNGYPPPWPAAVGGPGFTRRAYDVFGSADDTASPRRRTLARPWARHSSIRSTSITTASASAGSTERCSWAPIRSSTAA